MGIGAAPAGGAAVEGLGGLLLFVGFLVLLGLQKSWRTTIGWLFREVADWIDIDIGIPHLGSIHPFSAAADALRAADHNVYAALGYSALKLENGAVWLFHEAWRTLRWTGHEIAALAEEMFHGFRDLAVVHIPEAVRLGIHGLDRRARALERSLGGLIHVTIPHLRHGIAALGARVGHLARALPHDIALQGARIGITAKQLRRLGARVKRLEKEIAAATTAVAFAYALRKFGLRWLRCPALGRIGRKIGCGGFSWLETFFAEAFEALIVTDLCRFAIGAQRLARLVVPQLGVLLLVQNAVCLGGGATMPSAHDSPQVTTRVTLPSAHD